jgi:hypothetical protein
MLLVTDLDAFLFACGREDATQTWTSEEQERARLCFWETLGEADMVAYCCGRLSLLDGEREEHPASPDGYRSLRTRAASLPTDPTGAGLPRMTSGADQVTRAVLDPDRESEVLS